MKNKLYYLKKIGHWLLPHACILCKSLTDRPQDLCESCYRELPYLLFHCHCCAKPLLESKVRCGSCLTKPPSFDRVYALYFYQPPITNLIMDLKFGQALVNARVLGELLVEKIHFEYTQQRMPWPEVVIPMPMHPQRLKIRGYNQAVELARPVSAKLRIPLDIFSCQRIKHTAAQATLPASARHQNIQHAFKITNLFVYQHIAVIDDVMTTGATMMEFCKTLREAGAKKIDVWCCARPDF